MTTPQSWNAFSYAEDDPVNANDPAGEYSCVPSFGWSNIVLSCASTRGSATGIIQWVVPVTLSPIWMGDLRNGLLKSIAQQVAEGIGTKLDWEAEFFSGCFIELHFRYLNILPPLKYKGTHSYLRMKDRNGTIHTVEGGPDHIWPIPAKLVAHITDGPSYGLEGNNPSHDLRYGGQALAYPESDVCDAVDLVLAKAKAFQPTADYDVDDGPNSNSFMHWLVNQVPMLSSFITYPPYLSVGWGTPIPGNP